MVLLTCAQAWAQAGTESIHRSDRPAPWRGGLFVGGNFFGDDVELGNAYYDDQVPRSGFLFGGQLSRVIADWVENPSGTVLSVEGELRLALSRTDAVAERDSVSAPVFGWRAHAVLDLLARRKGHPFLLAGLGGETLMSGSSFMRTPDTDISLYGGFGGMFQVAEHGAIRADVRIAGLAGRGSGLASAFEFHIGYSHAFGRQAERIGKKILVSDTRAADEGSSTRSVEPRREPPAQPVDDPDLDGIVGAADLCPGEPEDRDEVEDEDGCPDLDDDGDGLVDEKDDCPDETETKNGFADSDGCPDEVPADLAAFVGAIPDVTFRPGTTQLERKSRASLERLAAVLERYPSVRIELIGHTDSSGDPEADRELSRRQAAYVKWFLVDKGITEKRIAVVARGSDELIGDRQTAAGRAANWRIELRLLPVEVAADGTSPVPVFTPPEATADSLPERRPTPVFRP